MCASLLGEKRTFLACCTSVKMKHLDGRKVKLVISYKWEGGENEEEPSFYVSHEREDMGVEEDTPDLLRCAG